MVGERGGSFVVARRRVSGIVAIKYFRACAISDGGSSFCEIGRNIIADGVSGGPAVRKAGSFGEGPVSFGSGVVDGVS